MRRLERSAIKIFVCSSANRHDMTQPFGTPPFKGSPCFNYNWYETDMKEIKFGYLWTIKKFSQLQEGPGEVLQSSTFSAIEDDTNTWCLRLYPRGILKKNEAYVSLFLRHEPESVKVSATFEFSVLNNKKEKTRIHENTRCIFTKKTPEWGFGVYIERDYLLDEMNGLLPKDELTICCEIVLLAKPSHTRRHYNAMVEFVQDAATNRLADDLGRLVNSKDFSDVVLVAEDGKELHAHKNLLGARSPVFAAMFRHDMLESRQNRVVVSDIGFNVLTELVRFMYTGRLPATDDKMLMQLLSAADQYALDDLKKICDQALSVKVTAENVLQFIPLASLQNCDQLKARIIQFMKSRTTDNVVNQLWDIMLSQHPQLVAGALQSTP